jgi:hypothetical protein
MPPIDVIYGLLAVGSTISAVGYTLMTIKHFI